MHAPRLHNRGAAIVLSRSRSRTMSRCRLDGTAKGKTCAREPDEDVCRRYSGTDRLDPAARQGAAAARRPLRARLGGPRGRELSGVDDLVVATTTEPGDDAVVAECGALGVDVVRGPVDDVLTRFLGAIDGRSTSARWPGSPPTARCSTRRSSTRSCRRVACRTVARLRVARRCRGALPRGMDVEVVRAYTLRASDATATDHHRMHVTSAIYTASGRATGCSA